MNNEILGNHLKELLAGGFDACELVENNQSYIEVRKFQINSPPWNRNEVGVLIAIPNTYNIAGLDGFYVENGLNLAGEQSHSRIQAVHSILGRQWRIVSWHYQDKKPWTTNDTLLTHVHHCRQFFKQGARKD